jgi:O-antigen/teichoic acid export membrane protein
VAPGVGERPVLVPFAVVFGVLVTAEDLYLAWLMWTPEVGWDWFMVVPLLFAVLALAATVAVFRGRARGWLLLAVAAVLPLIGLLILAVLFALLGGGQATWAAVLLLVGPVGCLVLALRRPVREWSRPVRVTRPPGGRRGTGSSR